MSERNESPDDYSVSIGRRPVFDHGGRLWGYDLFCIGSRGVLHGAFPDASDAAISIVSSAYLCLQQILQGGKKIIVDFTEKSVLDKLPYALPPVFSAIQVGEDIGRQPETIEVLNRLKIDGYPIAIRGFSGNADYEPLYKLANIIGIETRGKEIEKLQADMAKARQYNALLLAAEVQDRELYEICRDLKFLLFSGPFFKHPDKVTVRKLSSNEILRFKILRTVETEDPEIRQIAKAIQSDATISFRLLAFLNSAAFAFHKRIESIHQAVSLLGWYNVKNWLQVILLTDMGQSKEAKELVLLSAQRGMFMECIARDHNFWGFNPESLHLLGLFSLMDALIGIPMAEIVGHLPIDNKLKAALCRESNNEYVPLLQLAQYLEEAGWADAEAMIQQLNLDRSKVMSAFQKSINWVDELASLPSNKSKIREE
jgi:EAL and modified HD-GYP domain-containing signal transduction protein